MSSTSTLSPPPRITQSAYFPKSPSESSKRGKESAKAQEKGKGKSKAEEVGGHTDEVLALALSHDGSTLASGGKDKVIGVWNVEGEGGKWKRGLGGHKDKVAVSSVSIHLVRSADSSLRSRSSSVKGHSNFIRPRSIVQSSSSTSRLFRTSKRSSAIRTVSRTSTHYEQRSR